MAQTWKDFYDTEEEFGEAAAQFGRTKEQHLASLIGSVSGGQQPAPVQPAQPVQPIQPAAPAPVQPTVPKIGDVKPIAGTSNVTGVQWQFQSTAANPAGEWVLTPIPGQTTTVPGGVTQPFQPPPAKIEKLPKQVTIGPAPPDWDKIWKEQIAQSELAAREWLISLQTQAKGEYQSFLNQYGQAAPDVARVLAAMNNNTIAVDNLIAANDIQGAAQALLQVGPAERQFFLDSRPEVAQQLTAAIQAQGVGLSGAPQPDGMVKIFKAAFPFNQLGLVDKTLLDKAKQLGWKELDPGTQTMFGSFRPITTEELDAELAKKDVTPRTQFDVEVDTIGSLTTEKQINDYKAVLTPTLETYTPEQRTKLEALLSKRLFEIKQAAIAQKSQDFSASLGKPGELTDARSIQVIVAMKQAAQGLAGVNDIINAALRTLYGKVVSDNDLVNIDATDYDAAAVDNLMPQIQALLNRFVAADLAGVPMQWDAAETKEAQAAQVITMKLWEVLSKDAPVLAKVVQNSLIDTAKGLKTGEVRGDTKEVYDAVSQAYPEMGSGWHFFVTQELRKLYTDAKTVNPDLSAADFVTTHPQTKALLGNRYKEAETSAQLAFTRILGNTLGIQLTSAQNRALLQSGLFRQAVADYLKQTTVEGKFVDYWAKMDKSTKSQLLGMVKGDLEALSEPQMLQAAVDAWLTKNGAPKALVDAGKFLDAWRASGKSLDEFIEGHTLLRRVMSKAVEDEKQVSVSKQAVTAQGQLEQSVQAQNVQPTDVRVQNAIGNMIAAFKVQGQQDWDVWYNSDAAKPYKDSLQKTIESAKEDLSEEQAAKEEAKKRRSEAETDRARKAAGPKIAQRVQQLLKDIGVDPRDWNSADFTAVINRAIDAFDPRLTPEEWISNNTWLIPEVTDIAISLITARRKEELAGEEQQAESTRRNEQIAARAQFAGALSGMGLSGMQRIRVANYFDELYYEWKGRGVGMSFGGWIRSLGAQFLLDLLPTEATARGGFGSTVYTRGID